jgi:dipeptidyl aminopeptidase/acylaminoacyl peptidase
MRFLLGALCSLGLSASVFAGRPMTIDDLLAVKAVSDPQVSPDGKSVVYVVTELDRATDKSNSDLWLVPTVGGEPRRLTTAPGTDSHPRWSPDGTQIAFASDRGGSPQVWLLPVAGGEARALTSLPVGISGPIWSPRGDTIAFAADVYPGKTPEETAAQDKEKAQSKSGARTFDRLLIRHWSGWDEGKRSHLFVVDAETGAVKDLTPTLEVNTPPAPFGDSSDYAFSPDGAELAFTAEPKEDRARSTNTDIWTVPVEGGEPENLTVDNTGADAQPAYSPDGGALAWVSQARAGFESDLWVLKVLDRKTGKVVDVSSHLDRPVQSFVWADHVGTYIDAVLDDAGGQSIAEIFVPDAPHRAGVPIKRLISGGTNSAIQVMRPQLRAIRDIPHPDADFVYVHADAGHPGEIHRAKYDGTSPTPLTEHNAPLLSALELAEAEGFTFEGANGDKVSGWLIRPPGFDPEKKYPVIFLIHGGPQGAWHDEWHARWNYQMFAAPGYAVVAINPRGSTGYGQEFTDQISRDWTGRVYEDLMKGLDHALKAYPFLDGRRVAAAGGSYGGFMVNWIAGHSDRFRALISHAGVFDLESMYTTTEELWFPEWEFGGPPWEQPELYRAQSPSRFVDRFRTPTLVIHGARDYRVPDAQGLGMFTALQRRGVPSRLLLFPDEGHWVLKAPNRVVWWREVHGWLAKYLKPSAS